MYKEQIRRFMLRNEILFIIVQILKTEIAFLILTIRRFRGIIKLLNSSKP